MPSQKLGRTVFSALAAFCGFALVLIQLFQHNFPISKDLTLTPKVADIGTQMLGVKEEGYALPFELVSMLLLAALIGCIVIAMRSKPQTT